MKTSFIQAKNGEFVLNNERIIFRGFAIGTWMNFEHFMIGIPGIEKKIRQTFAEVYGQENAAKFFDDFLNYFVTEDDFLFLKSLGVNVLRLGLNYRHFEDDQAPGDYKEAGFKHLDRVLKLCQKHGIYAILDMHAAPGGQNADWHSDNDTGLPKFWEDASHRARLINLWGHIAKRYKDEPIIAGFDLINEPAFVSDAAAFNDFFEKVIRKIRAVDNHHILFLEGDDWSKDFSIFKKLGGPQQALSFHLYPGQHVSLLDDSDKRKAELEKIILRFCELRQKTGMPLWVGETGGFILKDDRYAKFIQLVKDGLDLFEKHRISWTFWSYKDVRAMSLVYPKDNTPWLQMANELKPKRLARESEIIAKETLAMLEEKFSYSIGETEKRKLSFRIFALLDELHIQQLVKPKLQSIPWNEMKEYPKSFLWENCDYWPEIAELVKSYMPVPTARKQADTL